MTVRRRALVVLAAGPTRDAVRRLVAAVAESVAVAGDPFEATARFAEAPADVVVAGLQGWRLRDLAFVRAVRARRPAAGVIVLVPDASRGLAAKALACGADAALREPVDLDELSVTLQRLVGRTTTAEPDGDALARLASQIGHAINNPLQVASLLLEDPAAFGVGGAPHGASPGDPRIARTREALRAEFARIRDAVAIVATFGRRGPVAPTTFDLATLVRARWDVAVSTGLASPLADRGDAVTAAPLANPFSIEAHADPDAVGAGVDALLTWLAFQAPSRPAPLRIAARPSTAPDARGVEVAARVEGLQVTPERVEAARGEVLCVDEAGRTPHPGLALTIAVASAHGGTLVRREGRRGTVLALRLPGTR